MINLLALRPSEWRKIRNELLRVDRQDDFLEGMLNYLKHAVLDGGAGTDRIYTLALRIESSKVLDFIENARTLDVLKQVDYDVGKVFLSGLAVAREQAILSALKRWRQESEQGGGIK